MHSAISAAWFLQRDFVEYQDIVPEEFVTRVVGKKPGKLLVRLQDYPIMEGLTLELYDTTQVQMAIRLNDLIDQRRSMKDIEDDHE